MQKSQLKHSLEKLVLGQGRLQAEIALEVMGRTDSWLVQCSQSHVYR